jgi:hypothetical protein
MVLQITTTLLNSRADLTFHTLTSFSTRDSCKGAPSSFAQISSTRNFSRTVEWHSELILNGEFPSCSESQFFGFFRIRHRWNANCSKSESQHSSQHPLEHEIEQRHLNKDAEITWLTRRRELAIYEKVQPRIWQTRTMRICMKVLRNNNGSGTRGAAPEAILSVDQDPEEHQAWRPTFERGEGRHAEQYTLEERAEGTNN